MAGKYSKEAEQAGQENSRREAWQQWIAQRVAMIHQSVTVFDILSRNSVKLRNSDREVQFSCPFHGQDSKPSARAYPMSARGPSHVWCFVCNERWDAIKLWKKFERHSDEVKFGRLLREIENAFGIVPPDIPEDSTEYEPTEDPAFLEVQDLFEVCERRLKKDRKKFEMQAFLRLGVVLDRLRLQVNEQRILMPQAKEVLTQVRDKIGARVRACPED